MCLLAGGVGRGQLHVWGGVGQRLVGDILDNVVLPHQSQDPRQLAGWSHTSSSAVQQFGSVSV